MSRSAGRWPTRPAHLARLDGRRNPARLGDRRESARAAGWPDPRRMAARWSESPPAVRAANVRAVELSRAAWAVLLLTAPGGVLRAAGSADRRAARAALRVLGVRHIVQAAMSGLRPRRTTVGVGSLVDALHAASDVAIAVADPRYRRIAAIDAGIAATLAWLGCREATRRR